MSATLFGAAMIFGGLGVSAWVGDRIAEAQRNTSIRRHRRAMAALRAHTPSSGRVVDVVTDQHGNVVGLAWDDPPRPPRPTRHDPSPTPRMAR